MTIRAIAIVTGALIVVSCAKDPQESARWYAARGDDFAERGRDDAALLEYRNAIREAPGWSEGYRKLGDSFERLGRTNDAYRAYAEASKIVDGKPLPGDEAGLREVVANSPSLVPARIALADLLLAQRDPEGAEEQLRAATAAEPDHELANRALAAMYIASDRTDQAESCLKIAAAHEPQRYRSRLALADFLLSQRRYDEARSSLEDARRDRRLADLVKLRLAAIDDDEGRFEEAEDAVTELLERTPSAEAWTLRAQFRLREKKFADALDSARKALALDPLLTVARDLVDEIRQQQLRAGRDFRVR